MDLSNSNSNDNQKSHSIQTSFDNIESSKNVESNTDNYVFVLDKSLSKNDKVKEILTEAFETPWFKSMVKIVYSPYLILKIFLFIFILVSTGYASYLTIESIVAYLEYGVTSKTRTFSETPTLFPKVTFCNANRFTTEYAFNLTQMGINDASEVENDKKILLGHKLEDILKSCVFNDAELCSPDQFVWSFDPHYGNCYTFNAERFYSNGSKIDLKTSSIAGPFYGLELLLYVNVYEPLLADSVDSFGAIIRIGNSSYSTHYTKADGILILPGTLTHVAVNRELKSLQPKPYSDCEIDSNSPKFIQGLDLYNLIAQSNYLYTQELCFIQCYQEFLIDKYNCSDPNYLSLFTNVSECTYEKYKFGPDDVFNVNFINKHCFAKCPLECDQISFKTSLSSTLLNGNKYISYINWNANLTADFLNRTIDAQTAAQSYVSVKIFYETLSYTHSTESPQMDGVYLLGSIGGNLGLFLGISVFSICEVVQVVIEIIFVFKQQKITGVN